MFIGMFGVACSKVPAGHVGVKVNLLGGKKGVDVQELKTGRYWIGMNEELHLFPTFQQNYVWTLNPHEGSLNNESISFQTKEGLEVNGDIGISYTIDPTKVTTIFTKYRKGVNEITDTFLRNYVRDALNDVASTMPVTSVYGEGKAKLIKDAQKLVADAVSPIGINIDKLYLVSKLRLPDTVVRSINSKIEATQRAQQRENEVAEARAEANKKIEEARGHSESMAKRAEGEAQSILLIANAKAKANKVLSSSLTPNLIKYKRIEKWNGELSKVSGNGSIVSIKDL